MLNATRVFLILALGASLFTERCLGEALSLKHTEGTGLGYSIGYSSLNLFLSKTCEQVTPFIDVRGHVFNNGKPAANAGLGVRYYSSCYKQIWGINVFYDYLRNTRHVYNQVGAGLEAMGEKWDFRCNAYVPVGSKRKNIYRFRYGFYEALRNEDLSHFDLGLKAREQFALNGLDATFGYRFCTMCSADFRLSGGPYYYWGRTPKTKNAFASKHKESWGGRLSLDMSYKDYICLTGTTTYDSFFKWRGQGIISLNIPFDLIFTCCHPRCVSGTLRDRLFAFVERNEIIPVDCLNRFINDPRVLDPEFKP
jgi:hypothetical protein